MFDNKYHNSDLSEISFLITGGAGFIGSNIAEYLLKYGAKKVRVLDNLETGYFENIEAFINNPAFEFIKGDICDKETCEKAMQGIDIVTHQAALGSVPRSINDPMASTQTNIIGFLNVILAARDAGVKRVVYAGSSSTYGDSKSLPKVEDKIGNPLSPYAVTKYADELFAEVFANIYQMNIVGLRYFNVFGPRQNKLGPYAAVIPIFISAALTGEVPTINGDGLQSRDFTFIENVVQANVKSMLSENILKNHEVINVAYSDTTSLNKLWEYICEQRGSFYEPYYGPDRNGDVRDSLADISKAKKMIDYNPLYSVKDGLKITYDWYKDYYGKN